MDKEYIVEEIKRLERRLDTLDEEKTELTKTYVFIKWDIKEKLNTLKSLGVMLLDAPIANLEEGLRQQKQFYKEGMSRIMLEESLVEEELMHLKALFEHAKEKE